MIRFNHFNFNVFDLEKSLEFYKDALNLTPVREKKAPDGSFRLVYLGDEAGSDFTLELTWLRDRETLYNLGDLEYHLAFTADNFDELHEKHQKMGTSRTKADRHMSICLCFIKVHMRDPLTGEMVLL